jgi:hypothetical protein
MNLEKFSKINRILQITKIKIMTKFKFFRGYVGTLDLMDGQTYATASLYNPNTIRYEDRSVQISRRIQLDEELRNHGRISHEQYNLNRDMLIEQERIRRLGMINHSRETDNQIRLFQATTTVTVNPTLWTKVKIFGTRVKLFFKECFRQEPIGLIFVTLLTTIITFIGIAKLFGS